jgi:hypothetical protein
MLQEEKWEAVALSATDSDQIDRASPHIAADHQCRVVGRVRSQASPPIMRIAPP